MEMYKASGPDRYELWRETPKCSINLAGSAPAMEKEGMKQIFSRSISDRKLSYTDIINTFAYIRQLVLKSLHNAESENNNLAEEHKGIEVSSD